jgi:phage tail-like protein
MAVGERNDPFGQFNFLIDIDGVEVAGFSECSGLTTDTDAIDYREGADPQLNVRKLSGLRKYTNVVLKRGYTKDDALWNWRKDIINGKVERKSGSITLLDEQRTPVLRWKFREGWIGKWEGPGLNAKTSDVAIESLEIVHEGLEMEVA